MSTLFQGHYVQFFDDNGDPLSGGAVDFYEPGTSTPKDVYTDSALSTPAQNPVTLDAGGKATLWLNGDYKVRLKDSAGAVVKTTDNVNPPEATETSSGNIIANGSFETQGNSATEASGWTLTAQSDGSVERITTDNNHGTACLKFTSDGSGGGQADTDAFFPVADSRTYEVSFALKCSVADIRNIVQLRYFDADQVFVSNSTVYDEAAANPTAWALKNFTETPPTGARFAKLRILGADQSDATPGEAKFDEVTVRTIRSDSVSQRFPNVNATVNATDEDLNSLTGHQLDLDAILDAYDEQTVELGGEFDAGVQLKCSRIGNAVTLTTVGHPSHTNTSTVESASGVIPSQFRPTVTQDLGSSLVDNVFLLLAGSVNQIGKVSVSATGDFTLSYYDISATSSVARSGAPTMVSISYLIV